MIVNKIKLPKHKIKDIITIICLFAGITLALGGYPPVGIILIIMSLAMRMIL